METDVLSLLLNATPSKLPEKDYKIIRLSEELGADVIFKLRALPYSRVSELRSVDQENYLIHIVLAGVISPNLRDQALMDKYDATTPVDALKALLLPGEIDDLAIRVEQLSGYKKEVTEEIRKN